MDSIASTLSRLAVVISLTLSCAACKLLEPRPPQQYAASGTVAPFSLASPGGSFPHGWKTAALPKFRKLTHYTLVNDAGTTVVHAVAHSSSSGLAYDLNIDPHKLSAVRWRWKVPR